jgi:Ca2+-binding EF-hand superfamily protein
MKSIPQLQVIVEALGKGMSSIGFVGLILFIFFYFFGIIGMILFRENDPWHFGSLHMTMITLFQCATLDDWTPVLYINMYGCDAAMGIEWGCDNPNAGGIVAALYFVYFILVGGLVLLTLFIGVVSMGMDEAEQEQKEETKVNARVDKVKEAEGLDDSAILLYREVFNVVDFTHSNKIGQDEMRFGMTVANMTLTDEEFVTLFNKVDKDNSNGIDFAEFLEFMFDLKDQLNTWPADRRNSIGRRKKKKSSAAFAFMDSTDNKSVRDSARDKARHDLAKVVPTDGDDDSLILEYDHSVELPPIQSAWSDNESDSRHSQSTYEDAMVVAKELRGDTPARASSRDVKTPSSIRRSQSNKDRMATEEVSRREREGGPIAPSPLGMSDPLGGDSPAYDSDNAKQQDSRGRSRVRGGGDLRSPPNRDAVSPDDLKSYQDEIGAHKIQLRDLQEQLFNLTTQISLLSVKQGGAPVVSPDGSLPNQQENLVPSQILAHQSQQTQMLQSQLAAQQQVMHQQSQIMAMMLKTQSSSHSQFGNTGDSRAFTPMMSTQGPNIDSNDPSHPKALYMSGSPVIADNVANHSFGTHDFSISGADGWEGMARRTSTEGPDPSPNKTTSRFQTKLNSNTTTGGGYNSPSPNKKITKSLVCSV